MADHPFAANSLLAQGANWRKDSGAAYGVEPLLIGF
jgi:hypothetical protein